MKTWLFEENNPTGRVERCVQDLINYDFEIIHRKGTNNVVPDAISHIYETADSESDFSAIDIAPSTKDKWYKKKS